MRHNLKTDKKWLSAVTSGEKRAEIRKADRHFAKGDELLLYTPDKSEAELVRVLHVLPLDEVPEIQSAVPFVSLSIQRERSVIGDAVLAELKSGDFGT